MRYADRLLIGICEKLQLPSQRYEQADERYHTIAEIIERDEVFRGIDLRMYAHGSFRLKTTVKPLKGNEYDLDFVVEIPKKETMTPQQLYDHIFRILSNDGVHNHMIEKKSRCIRVNYKNDFHMDIMPGKVFNVATKEIIVPDRELKGWYHHSNPIRYAEWFEEQAKTRIAELHKKGIFAESAEPLSEQEMASKLEPLRRATQLIKRYRDVYCDKNGKVPVRSIVLCTLLGNISSEYFSEISIINDFCTYVNTQISYSGREPFEVRNPVVDELLTEKWEENKRNYTDFVGMMQALTADMQKLTMISTCTETGNQIKRMFGDEITVSVITEQAEAIKQSREAGRLWVNSSGILNWQAEGARVRNNTFYGEG